MVLSFPILADYALVCVDGLNIFATHGHRFNLDTPPMLSRNDVLLHGHTHVPTFKEFGCNNLYVNPGSVALPKENNPKTYLTYENKVFTLKMLDGTPIRSYEF